MTYHSYLNEKKTGKVEKLVCGIEDVIEYVIHISALKQSLNDGLRLTNVHRVIRLNQQAWLKPYIDMNTTLRKQAKNNLKRTFLS